MESSAADAAAKVGPGPSESSQARAYFQALGRFAEPRLQRALVILGGRAPEAARAFLTEIEGPKASWALGE